MVDQVKMVEVSHGNEKPIACGFDKCQRKISLFDKYFLDTLHDKTYCHQCGICLRYARSKAIKRGELIDNVEIR